MVCIPVDTDQPLVAYRVADELGMGISLDYAVMSPNDIYQAVHKVVNDKSYYERTDRFSKISNSYPGYLNGANLIIDLLNKQI